MAGVNAQQLGENGHCGVQLLHLHQHHPDIVDDVQVVGVQLVGCYEVEVRRVEFSFQETGVGSS